MIVDVSLKKSLYTATNLNYFLKEFSIVKITSYNDLNHLL